MVRITLERLRRTRLCVTQQAVRLLPLSRIHISRAKSVVERAVSEASRMGSSAIGTAHLLMGCLLYTSGT